MWNFVPHICRRGRVLPYIGMLSAIRLNEMNPEQINNEENQLSQKIIQHPETPYKLWLEFEETEPWEDITNDFANIAVDTMDGRYYGINVWTKKYSENNKVKDESGEQIPDLIVDRLTREQIQISIDKILSSDTIENALNQSTFNLQFLDPYWSVDEMDQSAISSLMKELKLELNIKHPLRHLECDLIARKINNDDIVLKLADDRIAVVHLTWKSIEEIDGYPITRMYDNEIEFWKREMSKDIIDYRN